VLQLSGFTAFYNPNSGSSFDQKDWNELTGPDFNFDKEKRIIEDVYKSVMKPGDGKYMYWWDEGEVKNSRGKWPGTKDIHYFQTTTIRGVPFYFTGIPNIQRCAMGMNNAACK
jgi:hypothetical protein